MFNKLSPALFLTLTIVLPHISAKAHHTPSNSPRLGEEREPKRIQPKFRLMKLYINSFEDYSEQVKGYLEQIEETCPTEYDSIIEFIKGNTQTATANLTFAKKVENSIYALNNGGISPTKLLYDWLGMRFMILTLRQDFVSKNATTIQTTNLQGFLGLGDPHCPLQFVPSKDFAEFLSNIVTKASNDQFELFNHLIASLYHTIPKHQLTPQVKEMISASPNLWPLLRGESAESLDMDSSLGDYTYYNECIRQSVRVPITYLNHIKTQGTTLVTASEAGLSNLTLPEPEWLYGKLQEQVTAQKVATKGSFIEAAIVSEPGTGKKKKKRKKKTKNTSPQQPPKQAETELPLAAELAPQQKDTEEFFQEEESDEISISQGDQVAKEFSSLPARGNRVFHAEWQETPSDQLRGRFANKLKAKNRELLRKIFDNSLRGQGFCFRELENLWEKLNGKRSIHTTGRGGSHRVLKWDPNQDGNWVVVGSTFAHGPNHTYTSKTVRYIRDAFIAIGYPWDIEEDE